MHRRARSGCVEAQAVASEQEEEKAEDGEDEEVDVMERRRRMREEGEGETEWQMAHGSREGRRSACVSRRRDGRLHSSASRHQE